MQLIQALPNRSALWIAANCLAAWGLACRTYKCRAPKELGQMGGSWLSYQRRAVRVYESSAWRCVVALAICCDFVSRWTLNGVCCWFVSGGLARLGWNVLKYFVETLWLVPWCPSQFNHVELSILWLKWSELNYHWSENQISRVQNLKKMTQ